MRVLHRFFTRLSNFILRRRGEERLREEMESHLAFQTEENLRAGMAPREARRQARLQFGTVEMVREDYSAERGLPFLENLLLDLRYALRTLRRSPAFTLVAVVTLMLGIGANVVVFSVVNAVLLHPLEVSDPGGLYQIRHKQWMSGRLLTTSYPAFEDLRRRNITFSGMAGVYGYSHATMHWNHDAVNIAGDAVTGNYFDLLGVEPQLGRFFHEADERGPGSAPYVVLSDALWRSIFHADPKVVGATVELNRRPFTIVGVATPSFHGAERFVWPDFWMPMVNEADPRNRTALTVTVLGRLKPGVTPQQATDDLDAISARLAKEYQATDDGQPMRLIHPGLIGDEGDVIRGFLWGVTALALLVLAAACANLATLFTARAADRSRELALRVALGSSRQRLVRQLLTEAVLVSLTGGVAGLWSAALMLGMLNRSAAFAGSITVGMDARVFFACLGLSLGSALLFGLTPARQVWRSTPLRMMRTEPTQNSQSAVWGRIALRDVLLGLQIAICTLLVTASLVAVRGMVRTLHIPLGFQPQGAMLAGMDLGQAGEEGEAAIEKETAMLEVAREFPGVTAAGMVSRTPMTGGMHGTPIFRPGATEFRVNQAALLPYVFAMSPGYFEAADTRLLSGRDVSWHDTMQMPAVAIVNQTLARRMWGETPAIGQRFILGGKLTEVVGVAEDGKYHDLTELPQPVVYLPLSQTADNDVELVVRSRLQPNETAALQRMLRSLEPDVPISFASWANTLSGELFPQRAATGVLGVLGLLAAMLAVTGVFGMAAYSVSRRKKELGIRVALGARKMQVMRAALGRSVAILGIGAAMGLLAGVFTGRLMQQMVYQANPHDPIVLGCTVLTMVLLGVVATAIPARRALALDPSRLMRED